MTAFRRGAFLACAIGCGALAAIHSKAVAAPQQTSNPQPAQPTQIVLSPQAQWVSDIAARNGDRNFFMVDKTHNKIILFKNGRPESIYPALTGASSKDSYSKGTTSQDPITPAGRFTLGTATDGNHFIGEVLKFNEVNVGGSGIAIHKVYLGNPSEHRDARLLSPYNDDKYITEGCINVAQNVFDYLLSIVNANPLTRMPVYVLPRHDQQIAEFFLPRNEEVATRPASGTRYAENRRSPN